MRLILTAMLLCCFTGMASASIEVVTVSRSSASYIDNILLNLDGTIQPSVAISTYISDGVSMASSTSQAVGISPTSLTFLNSSSATGSTAYGQASLSMLFNVTGPTSLTIDFLKGKSGYANLITPDSNYIWTPTDDASITIQLDQPFYLLEAYWFVTDSVDQINSSLVFSSTEEITFDSSGGGSVPEPSTIAVWSLLGLAMAGGVWWKRQDGAGAGH